MLSSLLASTSCLFTIVETDDIEEVLRLIDMVNVLSVDEKYLLLIVPTFDSAAIQNFQQFWNGENMTINYNVVVHHKNAGDNLIATSNHLSIYVIF